MSEEELPATALQTLARELNYSRGLLKQSLTRQRRLEQQLVYQKARHLYFKDLTLGYERELGIRGAVRVLEREGRRQGGPANVLPLGESESCAA